MSRRPADRARHARGTGVARAFVLLAPALLLGCSATDTVTSAAGPATVAPRGTAPAPGSVPGATEAPAPGTTAGTAPALSPSSTTTTAGPVTTTAKATTTSPPYTAAPAARATVAHAVATTTLRLVDPSRPTISRGTTVAPSRSLPTTVFYPSDGGGPFPLIVFAHGFQIGPAPYARFCQVLAAAGYVVAAPSFPLTDGGAAGANLDRGDLPNQAGDVSFVASSVASAPGPLQGVVDAGRLGVVGHSDGADTALDVGYYPGRNDSRFTAVVALSPDAMTGPGGSAGTTVPLLVQHGDRDTIVPYSNSKTVFTQVRSHRFFLTLVGADHLPPVQGASPWAAVLDAETIRFLDRYVAGRSATDDDLVAGGTRQGVATLATAG